MLVPSFDSLSFRISLFTWRNQTHKNPPHRPLDLIIHHHPVLHVCHSVTCVCVDPTAEVTWLHGLVPVVCLSQTQLHSDDSFSPSITQLSAVSQYHSERRLRSPLELHVPTVGRVLIQNHDSRVHHVFLQQQTSYWTQNHTSIIWPIDWTVGFSVWTLHYKLQNCLWFKRSTGASKLPLGVSVSMDRVYVSRSRSWWMDNQ